MAARKDNQRIYMDNAERQYAYRLRKKSKQIPNRKKTDAEINAENSISRHSLRYQQQKFLKQLNEFKDN